MTMHNPPYPGEFIREVYLEPFGITGRQLSSKLGDSPSMHNRILKGNSGVSSEMALRLQKPWVALLKAGWLCRTTMISGMSGTVNLEVMKRLNLERHN